MSLRDMKQEREDEAYGSCMDRTMPAVICLIACIVMVMVIAGSFVG